MTASFPDDDLEALFNAPSGGPEAGLDLPELDSAPDLGKPAAAPGAALPDDFDLPDDFRIPDDLSDLDPETLTEKSKRELAMLITRVAFPTALAGACALADVAAEVVGTEAGAVALLHDIDGDAPEQAAAAITKVVAGVPALLVMKFEGQITVTQYLDGVDAGRLPPAVVLTSAAELVEELIVGAVKPSDVPGAVSSVGLSKVKAMRMIAEAARPRHGLGGHSFRGGRDGHGDRRRFGRHGKGDSGAGGPDLPESP